MYLFKLRVFIFSGYMPSTGMAGSYGKSIVIFFFLILLHHVLFYLFIFWPRCAARGILAPWSRIEPGPPALEAQSLNHRTSREVPIVIFLRNFHIILHSSCTKLHSYRFTFPSIVQESFLFSTTSPAFMLIIIFIIIEYLNQKADINGSVLSKAAKSVSDPIHIIYHLHQ